jgi:hypothetical protein
MPAIDYTFELVGGGFDGAPVPRWCDGGRPLQPPAFVFVAVCRPGQRCGSEACRGTDLLHVSWWEADEDVPIAAQKYERQEVFVERDEAGRAIYAIGGLLDPRNFGETARELPEIGAGGVGRPLTFAGAQLSPLLARACVICGGSGEHAATCPLRAS